MKFQIVTSKVWQKVPLILHLGAHRTGSTSLQILLDANTPALASKGVIVMTPPRPGKRNASTVRDLFKKVRKVKGGNFFVRLVLRAWIKRKFFLLLNSYNPTINSDINIKRLVISDEYFLGPAFEVDGLCFYVKAGTYLNDIKRLFGRTPDEVHLTVRSYDTFLVSVYAMRAIYGKNIPPFEQIHDQLINLKKGWVDLTNEIQAIFPKARVFVSLFEIVSLEQRFQDLVNMVPKEIPESSKFSNAAPTIEAIEAYYKIKCGTIDKDALILLYAEGRKFDPLIEHEKETLRERYLKDVEILTKINSGHSGNWPTVLDRQ